MGQPYATGYQGLMNPGIPIKILSGQSTSAPIPMGGFTLCGIKMPDAFTGTSLTFLACESIDGEFLPIYDSVARVSYAVGVDRYVAIDPADFQGVLFLQIVSSTNEAADRNLICSVKGF